MSGSNAWQCILEATDGNGDVKLRILFQTREEAERFQEEHDGANGFEFQLKRVFGPDDPRVSDLLDPSGG